MKLQLRQREGTPISNTVGPLFMASDQLPTFNDTQTNKEKQTYVNLNKTGSPPWNGQCIALGV